MVGVHFGMTNWQSLVSVVLRLGIYFLVLSALLAEATSDPLYLQAATESADFIHSHLYNVQNIVQQYISSTGCQVVVVTVDPTNSGLMIEGLSIFYSIANNASTQNLLDGLTMAVIPHTGWQGDNGIIAADGQGGNMNLMQGLKKCTRGTRRTLRCVSMSVTILRFRSMLLSTWPRQVVPISTEDPEPVHRARTFQRNISFISVFPSGLSANWTNFLILIMFTDQ
ncbi:hypothetical protein DFH08DRAFT_99338 [Mycena albidolilacea]|uniref:Uncharacterized protein n=1 Tax=Mycena albidolilacea TaxID=1033008 RepID=A0AAD7A7N3_9AGAR|nr:hypothetical protein DFH08DRAFT_99338 [Mycena albidolilacea]